MMTTHWIDLDAVPLGDQRRARCGALVDKRDHSWTPSCPDCALLLREDQEHLKRLQEIDEPGGWHSQR